jgi:hypothetical protein
VSTSIPGRPRSAQSAIPLGFPARTAITTSERAMSPELPPPRARQSGATSDALTSLSRSLSSASTATSASNPCVMARACAPEPRYDARTTMSRPVCRRQAARNAGITASSNASRGAL